MTGFINNITNTNVSATPVPVANRPNQAMQPIHIQQANRNRPNNDATVTQSLYRNATAVAVAGVVGQVAYKVTGNFMTAGLAGGMAGYAAMRITPSNVNTVQQEKSEQRYQRAIEIGSDVIRSAIYEGNLSDKAAAELGAFAVMNEGGTMSGVIDAILGTGGGPDAALHGVVSATVDKFGETRDEQSVQIVKDAIRITMKLTGARPETIPEVQEKAITVFNSGVDGSTVASEASKTAEELHSDTAAVA